MYASFIKMFIYISRFDCEVERNASNKTNTKGLGNCDYRAGSASGNEKSAAIALAIIENSVNDKTV